MISILINHRIFAMAIAVTMTTAFSSPATANEKKDSIPVELKHKGKYSARNFNLNADETDNGNSQFEISGKKINSKIVYVDFSWYKPEPPQDINPYDKIQLDFSWYHPAEPLDINPYTDKI
jgi:hypothetical protein